MEFDIKINSDDLYAFNMKRTYTSSSGIISILLAIIIWLIAGETFIIGKDYMYGSMYVVFGLIVLVYNPVSLRLRVNKTMKTNEVLAGVLHYSFSKNKICVSQGQEKAELEWDNIYKFSSDRKYIYIFTNRINAYILPKDQLGDKTDDLISMARKQLPKYRRNFK